MSLLKFFQVKYPTLPSSSTCAYFSQQKDLDHVNKEVKRVLAVENSGEKEALTPRGKYNSYSPEERAQIGKFSIFDSC